MGIRRGDDRSAISKDLFRLAASGNDDPALVASLEKPGLAYGSIIDSKPQFPVCETLPCGDRQAGVDVLRW